MQILIARPHDTRCVPLDAQVLRDVLTGTDKVVWMDMERPSADDLAVLSEAFGFHPLTLEDVSQAEERPKIEIHDGYYFIVVYAATYWQDAQQVDFQRLHLYVGANYLITIRQEPVPQVETTLQRWQAPGSSLGNTVGVLTYALLDAIVDDYFPILDGFADQIDGLENALFVQARDEEVLQTVFSLKKELLHFRHVVAPERDVLNVLLRRELSIFKARDAVYLQDIYNLLVRITETLDLYRDLLASALDSYLSFQSNRLNQTLKILTVASIILMTNALVAGIYGMNFKFMPELNTPLGYPFALGLMVVLSTTLILYFRQKGWL